VGLGLLTGGVFGLALWVHLFGRRPRGPRPPLEALVVLGALVRPDGRASPALAARARHAAALYHAGVAPLLVLSGGASGSGPSEARVALGLLRGAGVPEGACLLEEESRSTRDNARLTTPLLAARGLTRVGVVSDGFHLLRARRLFRRAGLAVATFPAPLAGRGLSVFDQLHWSVREALSLLRPSQW
jgi:uncharacterized SAM-binding protein YcdF (DUF218 family)